MSGIPEADSPAFPTTVENCLITGEQGISMRDYFAARAMQAIVSNEAMVARHHRIAGENNLSEEVLLASSAYQIADAMLAERAK